MDGRDIEVARCEVAWRVECDPDTVGWSPSGGHPQNWNDTEKISMVPAQG